MVSKKLTKSIATLMLSVTLFGSLAPSISVMANTPSEQQIEYQLTILDNHQEDLNNLVSQMEQYSYYDGETVHLDHKIVDDGILTEKQYQETKKVDKLWKKFIDYQRTLPSENTGKRQKRALPALLILALKAVGAIVGTVVVERITNDFMTWGLKEGCKAYKKYAPIKSFCKANGYI
ncbi:hypothetical protein [Streptococcus equi]|uniref:hypothetical protein n=2 Tax=Streptococcus equi TaxID=1336 RepID=UPI0024A8AA7E|nr:hypothetical protein [Streptococcus equi]MDI5959168.1 hypothetical protein [Streptococcus equi subsp. zooepidemicus]MDI5961082.1 hypothetical protein [Streptococcus equi subsp. zooepidemicus]MDI6036702.1 hypothetical protein [Streptococcus equi subsp. zooepidemicus]MDI6089634.1 hypothetical protein [Streptococcus equi subsp. zooepidemicus]HEL0736332.1 hypothetical protein [Streptococcus equi subsp. zooepidemicus]